MDLRTLTHALTDRKFKLGSACKHFNTEYQKTKQNTHGKITPQYIDYCINDVKSTFSLYQNATKEFETYKLNMSITNAYTPATIGKQFLKQMNVESFFDKNPDFPPGLVGKIMNCYYGGRVECKIRKTPTQVDFLDFLSMYPTVCTLQKLWSYAVSEKILYKEATEEIQKFVDDFTLEKIQDKESWKRLPAIVLIQPDEDVLPIRAQFGDKHAWNIGECYVSSKNLFWYSLADVLASKLLTGKSPKIFRAIKFVPEGIQSNLKQVEIHGKTINPYRDDFFKELVEYKQALKKKKDPKEKMIKVIANSSSYGIFVEILTEEESKPKPIEVHGWKDFEDAKSKVEKTQYMFNPIIAVAITSASRLLLASVEALLARHGESYAYCDTDSMAVSPQHSKQICEFFQELNPYDFEDDIFKLEEEKVWFYGISAKRYCIYRINDGTIEIGKDDYSAHGLGHLLHPFKSDPEDESDWQIEIWRDILSYHYGKLSYGDFREKYENHHALQSLTVSSPRIFNRFKPFNKNKDYLRKIKPRNFVLVGFSNRKNSDDKPIKPLAPFQNPPKHAVYDYFVDYNDATGEKLKGQEYWHTLWDTIESYLNHKESKFDGDVGILQRKHVTIGEPIHIGKESHDLDTRDILGLDEESYLFYGVAQDIEKKFEIHAEKILSLEPKSLRGFSISRQLLFQVKSKIKKNLISKISITTKVKFLQYFESAPLQ